MARHSDKLQSSTSEPPNNDIIRNWSTLESVRGQRSSDNNPLNFISTAAKAQADFGTRNLRPEQKRMYGVPYHCRNTLLSTTGTLQRSTNPTAPSTHISQKLRGVSWPVAISGQIYLPGATHVRAVIFTQNEPPQSNLPHRRRCITGTHVIDSSRPYRLPKVHQWSDTEDPSGGIFAAGGISDTPFHRGIRSHLHRRGISPPILHAQLLLLLFQS
jgi:hypothetical protein